MVRTPSQAKGIVLAAASFCLVLMLTGGWFFVSELRTFGEIRKDADSALAHIVERTTPPNPGLSYVMQTRTLEMCNDAMTARSKIYFDPQSIEHAATLCQQSARQALARTPAWGLAHMTLARALAEAGDAAAAQDAMALSSVTAPREGWIAQKRILLALELGSDLTPQTRANLANDIAVVASGAATLQWLARLYAARQGNRDMIAALIDAQPEDVQRRFLTYVRREMN